MWLTRTDYGRDRGDSAASWGNDGGGISGGKIAPLEWRAPLSALIGARNSSCACPSVCRRAHAVAQREGRRAPSQRVRAEHFPVVSGTEPVALGVVDRPIPQRLDVAARRGRGIEEQDATGVAAGVLPGMRHVAREEAQVPGPPTVTSSPILKAISPASTQATSSLSRCRWKRLAVPGGSVSSNIMMLSPVSRPRSFKAAKRPGADMSRCVPPPAGTTKPLAVMAMSFAAADRA